MTVYCLDCAVLGTELLDSPLLFVLIVFVIALLTFVFIDIVGGCVKTVSLKDGETEILVPIIKKIKKKNIQ